jgi:hypothetical protein
MVCRRHIKIFLPMVLPGESVKHRRFQSPHCSPSRGPIIALPTKGANTFNWVNAPIRDLNLVGVTSQRSGCKSKHTACCLDGNIASGFVRVVGEFIKMHARIHVFCDRYHIVPAPNLLIPYGMIFIGEKNDKLN